MTTLFSSYLLFYKCIFKCTDVVFAWYARWHIMECLYGASRRICDIWNPEESDTQILKRSKDSPPRAVFTLSLSFTFSEMVYEKPLSCSNWGSNSQPRHGSVQVLLYKYRALTNCATGAHSFHISPVEPSRAVQVDDRHCSIIRCARSTHMLACYHDY